MKYILILSFLAPTFLLTNCSSTPADAAVDAATSNMGPAQSAAVRKTTGHGTGPVEKTKKNTEEKIENITN